jgi:hypothetical protein
MRRMPGANSVAIFWHCSYLFQSYADDARTGAEEARSNAKSRSSQSSRSARKPSALGRRSNISPLSSLGEYLHPLKHTLRLHLSQDPLPGGLCIFPPSFSWSIQRMWHVTGCVRNLVGTHHTDEQAHAHQHKVAPNTAHLFLLLVTYTSIFKLAYCGFGCFFPLGAQACRLWRARNSGEARSQSRLLLCSLLSSTRRRKRADGRGARQHPLRHFASTAGRRCTCRSACCVQTRDAPF